MIPKHKVSVCMITYNHEEYIREAIEGVLIQETNFDFELIIVNDCSTDNTHGIINDIIKAHPKSDIIKYIQHKNNIGMMPNFVFALKKCNAPYIALCEGDDYWTDPLKLQIQIGFLENNEDFSMCFHKVDLFIQEIGSIKRDTITREVPEITDINDLVIGNYMHTTSVVLRNDFILEDWTVNATIGDWVLYMLAIKNQKIKKIDRLMAVYRVHDKSIWSNKTREYKVENSIKNIELLLANLLFEEPIRDKLKLKLENCRTPLKPDGYLMKVKNVLNRIIMR